jgi:23S rRNA pseudouridine1911/1915/1917 synthase
MFGGTMPDRPKQPTSPAEQTSDPNVRPLLEWLLQQFPETPKNRAKQWIAAGRVSVGGQVIRKPHERIPNPGERLELGGRHASTLDCGAGWHIHPRVTLLHLDSAVAVVNKGPGLISVPAPDAELSALSILADFLAGRLKAQDHRIAGKPLPPAYRHLEPLPVHRLDQYTTGVFCMAMNPAARERLIDQLKVHSMQRTYVAFAEGRASQPKGTWRNWLQLSRDEMRQRVLPTTQARPAGAEALEAITHYEVVAEYPRPDGKSFVTKLRLRLETGRKHQIRAQAAHAGLPLVGDRTYNPEWRRTELEGARIDFPRQALHAETLNLEHPDKPGVRMTWKADLPKDLRQLEGALRAGKL